MYMADSMVIAMMTMLSTKSGKIFTFRRFVYLAIVSSTVFEKGNVRYLFCMTGTYSCFYATEGKKQQPEYAKCDAAARRHAEKGVPAQLSFAAEGQRQCAKRGAETPEQHVAGGGYGTGETKAGPFQCAQQQGRHAACTQEQQKGARLHGCFEKQVRYAHRPFLSLRFFSFLSV